MPPFDSDRLNAQRRVDIVLSLAFLALAGLLLIIPVEAQQQISSSLRGSVLAPFIWTQDLLRQTRVRAAEIDELQLQLDSTLAVVSSQRTLLEENLRLRALLDLRERGGAAFRSASVVRPGTHGSESMFLLDVGGEDGVRVNQPVVMAEGLVGVIREVGPNSSLAMDWTHPDFRVSAMTLDGETYGIVETARGAFREEDRLLLNGVPYHTSIAAGVPVVTSGRGTVYPRGILVGTVLELAETEAGWRRSYWLEPAVRPQRATHVLVLTDDEPLEVESLELLWIPELSPEEDEGNSGDPDGAGGEVPL